MTFQALVGNSDGKYKIHLGNPKTDVVALMSSSGTTGFPKAAMLSHYAIIATCLQQKYEI